MKFVSRKLIVALLGVAFIYLNRKLNLGYSDTEILTTAGILVTYIFGQSLVDKEDYK